MFILKKIDNVGFLLCDILVLLVLIFKMKDIILFIVNLDLDLSFLVILVSK